MSHLLPLGPPITKAQYEAGKEARRNLKLFRRDLRKIKRAVRKSKDGRVTLKGTPEQLEFLLSSLKEHGAKFEIKEVSIEVPITPPPSSP